MLVNATDVLASDTPASSVSISATTATPIYTPASYQEYSGANYGGPVPPATEHNGIEVSADFANTTGVKLLLGPGTVSATNWHVCLAPGGYWDGTVGGCVWRGAVSAFSASAAVVGVAVV